MLAPHQVVPRRSSLILIVVSALWFIWVSLLGRQVRDWVAALDPEPAGQPVYALAIDSQAGQPVTRGREPVLTVQRTDRLNILLRPSEPIGTPMVLRAFAGRGGEMRRWAAPFESRNDGGFVLCSTAAELPELQVGYWELALLVGSPQALPQDPHSLPAGPGGVGWQVLRLGLNIAPDTALGSLVSYPVKNRRVVSYLESKDRHRDRVRDPDDRGETAMPAHSPQLSRSHSIACLEIIRVWASSMEACPAQERIMSAVNLLSHALQPDEKLEPGSRCAADLPEPAASGVRSEKLEPGTRHG